MLNRDTICDLGLRAKLLGMTREGLLELAGEHIGRKLRVIDELTESEGASLSDRLAERIGERAQKRMAATA